MKKINLLSYLLKVTCMMLLLLSACKDKENPQPQNPDGNNNNPDTTDTEKPYTGPTGFLRLHLHNYLDDSEVLGYNEVYTNNAGRKILFTKAQLFISNIELIKKDGSVFKVPETIILKKQESDTYDIGNVPPGYYKSIRFYVGLDSETDKKQPSNDVLNNADMWYDQASAQPKGYVFVNFQGKIDTTTAANGSEESMVPFNYKLGTSGNYKQVIMPETIYAVIVNQTQFLHMYIDWNQLFKNVPLNDNRNLNISSQDMPNNNIETILKNNFSSMFKYED